MVPLSVIASPSRETTAPLPRSRKVDSFKAGARGEGDRYGVELLETLQRLRLRALLQRHQRRQRYQFAVAGARVVVLQVAGVEAVAPLHLRNHQVRAVLHGEAVGVATGLADAALMASDVPDLDVWHPWALEMDHAVDLAMACEAAGREADARIENSDGASVGSGKSLSVYANSHGFVGRERETQHTIGCALIAGQGDGMQRDGWYSTALSHLELDDPTSIGRKAAQRTVSRLQPRPLATGAYPVLFSAEVARASCAARARAG